MVMSVNRKDISQLHPGPGAVPSNMRDASGSSSWKHPPTPISTPSTQTARSSTRQLKIHNPYSGRTSSNLQNGNSKAARIPALQSYPPDLGSLAYYSGNPNASRTSASHYDTANPAKRRKVDERSSKGFNPFRLPPDRTNTSPVQGHDVIDIDKSLEEDIGERVPRHRRSSGSSDPIDCIKPEGQREPIPPHTSEKAGSHLTHDYAQRRRSQGPRTEGPSTKRVRRDLEHADAQEPNRDAGIDDDHDSVQSASGFDDRPSSARARTPKHQTIFPPIESKINHFSAASSAAVAHPISMITDLNVKRAGVKLKMKPRIHTLQRTNVEAAGRLDAVAIASSGFKHGQRNPPPSSAVTVALHLPLSAWAIGIWMSERTDYGPVNLQWHTDESILSLKPSSGAAPILECRLHKGSVRIVKSMDLKSVRSGPTIQLSFTSKLAVEGDCAWALKAGSKSLEGNLTLKFDMNAQDWDQHIHANLVHWLQGQAADKEFIDVSGANSIWQLICNAADLKGRQDIRSEDHMEIDDDMHKPHDHSGGLRPRARPTYQGKASGGEPVRRSTRLSGQEEKQLSPEPDQDEVILGYRSGTGSLNITNGDFRRLRPGEFLNDTLIEFGLKLWWADLQEKEPELAEQIHVFNSFFYKKLTHKNPEEGYNSVRKWTSKFDLFKKKYIIVPINENIHWYLAIIYMPEYVLQPPPVDTTSVAARRSPRQSKVEAVQDTGDTPTAASSNFQTPNASPLPPANTTMTTRSHSSSVVPESPEANRMEESDVENMIGERENAARAEDASRKPLAQGEYEASGSAFHLSELDLELGYPNSHYTSPAAQTSDLPGNGPPEMPAEVDAVDVAAQTSGVPPRRFYGSGSRAKGKQKATSDDMDIEMTGDNPSEDLDHMIEVGDEDDEILRADRTPVTRIYTFDSLASKHPAAVKRLGHYLQLEARDKKGLDLGSTTMPTGRPALVPHQPNFCDCGIYLLHFAKTFMKNPALSSSIIDTTTSPRKGRRRPHEHWDGASVGTYREELMTRIRSMSDDWKKERASRDGSGEKDTPVASTRDNSDSDVEVVQTVDEQPLKADGGKKAVPATKKGAATRLR